MSNVSIIKRQMDELTINQIDSKLGGFLGAELGKVSRLTKAFQIAEGASGAVSIEILKDCALKINNLDLGALIESPHNNLAVNVLESTNPINNTGGMLSENLINKDSLSGETYTPAVVVHTIAAGQGMEGVGGVIHPNINESVVVEKAADSNDYIGYFAAGSFLTWFISPASDGAGTDSIKGIVSVEAVEL